MNPLDWGGKAFLFLYIALFVVAAIWSILIPRRIRPNGRGGGAADADGLAYLAGRGQRMLEAAVARLLASGALVLEDGKRFLRGDGAAGSGALDHALLAVAMPADWIELAKATHPHVAPVERRLIAGGLMMEKGGARGIGLIAALPLLALFGFGVTKLMVGLSRDRPISFLAVLLVLTVIMILIRIFSVDRRTHGGMAALESARERHERLRRAPTQAETGTAVALFGTTVLVGSAFAALHQMRTQGDGGGPAGGGDGGGDGGCGGGGCGGCGGCGG